VSETGTGQGQTISPLLANVYLHYVLDEWFENEVKPRLQGAAHEIRFADDAVLCFQYRGDAEKVMEVLPKRFAKYGLTLHPEKTRLVVYQRSPLGLDSAPSGSRKGSIGIGAYSTLMISRCSVFAGARSSTRSPGLAFISALARGERQLM
jgi:hypothetical protein